MNILLHLTIKNVKKKLYHKNHNSTVIQQIIILGIFLNVKKRVAHMPENSYKQGKDEHSIEKWATVIKRQLIPEGTKVEPSTLSII